MKKLKVTGLALALITILGLSTLFISTTEINANSDWTVTLENDVNKDLGAKAYQTKENLLKQDVTSQIVSQAKDSLDPFIQSQEQELQRLLEEYYNSKLNNLVSGEELRALEDRIIQIKNSLFERYRKEIDAAFQ